MCSRRKSLEFFFSNLFSSPCSLSLSVSFISLSLSLSLFSFRFSFFSPGVFSLFSLFSQNNRKVALDGEQDGMVNDLRRKRGVWTDAS